MYIYQLADHISDQNKRIFFKTEIASTKAVKAKL